MPEIFGQNIGLGFGFDLGEDGWKNSFDRSQIVNDSLTQGFVVNSTILAEPGSPTVGDAYILPTGTKTGTNWGSDAGAVTNAVAIFTNVPGQVDSSPWFYITPKEGWRLRDRANNFWLAFDSAWFVDRNLVVNQQSGTSYSLVNTDLEAIVEITNAGAIVLTVPADSVLTRARVGTRIMVIAAGAGAITFTGAATVNGASGTAAQDQPLRLYRTGVDTWRAVT